MPFLKQLIADHPVESSSEQPSHAQRFIEQASFVLNPMYTITSFSLSVPETLGYPIIRLVQRDFASLLSPCSLQIWERLKQQMEDKISYHTITALTFLAQDQLPVPTICTIYKLLNNPNILISSLLLLKPYTPEEMAMIQSDRLFDRTRNDASLIQHLHEYILGHLDRPLPSIKQLARTLGTNEFKLKDGFKHYFNSGIYQFYNSERLGRARLMILQTDLPLNAIAEQCGFNSYSNFSKSFKKKFGKAPLQLKRQ